MWHAPISPNSVPAEGRVAKFASLQAEPALAAAAGRRTPAWQRSAAQGQFHPLHAPGLRSGAADGRRHRSRGGVGDERRCGGGKRSSICGSSPRSGPTAPSSLGTPRAHGARSRSQAATLSWWRASSTSAAVAEAAPTTSPSSNCSAEQVIKTAGEFGRSSRMRRSGFNSSNDSYCSPPLSRRMADAYRSAGGRVDFRVLPAFGSEGRSETEPSRQTGGLFVCRFQRALDAKPAGMVTGGT